MPTIKLISGSLTRTEDGKRVRYKAGATIKNVSEKLMRQLRCSVVPTPGPILPPPNKPREEDINELRAKCLEAGIEFKPNWPAAKLAKELVAHGNANRS